MNHTKLTQIINDKTFGVMSEQTLLLLDNLDQSVNYKIRIIDEFNDFLKYFTRKLVQFVDADDVNEIYRESKTNIYKLTDFEGNPGNETIKYFSNGKKYFNRTKKVEIHDLPSISIFINEKVSKELGKKSGIESIIVIYLK